MPGAIEGATAGPQMVDRVDEETVALVRRLYLDHATFVARARPTGELESLHLDRLATEDAELRARLGGAEGPPKVSDGIELRLEALSDERVAIVDALRSRDRNFAADLDYWRSSIEGGTPPMTPQRRQALVEYANGARVVSETVITSLAESDGSAAAWREVVAIRTEMDTRGEVSTERVIEALARLLSLDPMDFYAWTLLVYAQADAGLAAESEISAARALEVAKSDRERVSGTMALGEAQQRRGSYDEARKSFRAMLELQRTLTDANRADPQARRDLTVALVMLADLESVSSHPDDARPLLLEALGIRRGILDADPGSAAARWDVGILYERLGLLESDAGRLEDARTYLEESLRFDRARSIAHPTATRSRHAVGTTLPLLGQVLVRSGRVDEAKSHFGESADLLRGLRAEHPNYTPARRTLSSTLLRLGDAERDSGDLFGARQAYQESLQLRREALKVQPDSEDAVADVVNVLTRLGTLEKVAGDPQTARGHWAEAEGMLTQLVARMPADAAYAAQLDRVRALIAKLR